MCTGCKLGDYFVVIALSEVLMLEFFIGRQALRQKSTVEDETRR